MTHHPISDVTPFFCSDPDVQRFCEEEAYDFSPYKVQFSGHELATVCTQRFGLGKCYDFLLWLH